MNIDILGIKLGSMFECICGKIHQLFIKSVIIDENAIYKISKILDELSLSGKPLIIHDEITKKIAGDNLLNILKESGIRSGEYVMSRPTIEEVNRVQKVMEGYNYAVGVGGGSVIDTCKLASHKAGIPFISIPTALSHDGVVSATASIISEKGTKETFSAHMPVAVIFDLSILRAQPRRMLAAGCGDMLGKATSLKDWELAKIEKEEYYCPIAAKLSLQAFEDTLRFIQDGGHDIRSFSWTIFEIGAAMALVGSSRPASGSEHIISHYIDSQISSPAMHGEQVGIATILMSRYHSENNPYWWTEEKFQWYTIKRMLEQINAPTTINKLGLDVNIIIKALTEGYKIRPNRYTILHKRPMSREEAIELIKTTFV